ncbi:MULTISPECIES: hypothetical protein [Burkholderiaceae]|jgi:hypothetical protein|uniref:Uncharacterized protein n=2 Tax=Burkholderiaceae TaxID=119060 RepID=A0A6J5JHQ7_9BURK|nr:MULTISPECIES: hypothetical protein [Burkholderiaceae]ANJ73071.1 hypothetical protein A9Y76_11585 [Ralstonia insidiosa]KAB0601868.1 hypothetical protein F7R19_15320 [Cupriavidus pauculus]MBR8501601.1 hypothetical protein [Burkholderia cenocepacia]MCO8552985.1 hypothetical protein [Burkholderia multivorans]UAL00302.1 hypothetical protein K8O84_02680 [Cupriavidus pauculus]
MKNGHYKQITEIGLGQVINFFYFKGINYLEREFKKGRDLDNPVAIIIKGTSKMTVALEDMSKEEYVARLKVACHFIEADAIMIFSEASNWTGTMEEMKNVKEMMGQIHGHVKAVDVLHVLIETQGKRIIGVADIESKGNKRVMKSMKWHVVDLPEEQECLFSHFLPNQKEAA